MSKGNIYIRFQPLFESTQLIWIDEVVQNWMELKLITNDFLNEFFYGIK